MAFEYPEKSNQPILDLSFINKMEELGPENEEVQELAAEGAKKIIKQMVAIVEGEDIYKRADLRREVDGLTNYQKGALLSWTVSDRNLNEITKREIVRMLEA